MACIFNTTLVSQIDQVRIDRHELAKEGEREYVVHTYYVPYGYVFFPQVVTICDTQVTFVSEHVCLPAAGCLSGRRRSWNPIKIVNKVRLMVMHTSSLLASWSA